MALRAPRGESIQVDGQDVVPQVHAVLERMAGFTRRLYSGAWTGHTGRRLRNIVNIGIGGSDLGPQMAVLALPALAHPKKRFHFVSHVDGHELASHLPRLPPAHTPSLISSQTFTPTDTTTYAPLAKAWSQAPHGCD